MEIISQFTGLRIKFYHMHMISLFSVILGIFMLSSFKALAQEGVHTRIHHHYVSNRAMGMGDAFVANADDYTALFYNPAGLARRDSGQVNLSIEAGGSPKMVDFFKDAAKVDEDTKGASDAVQFAAYSEFLKQYYGKPMLVRTGLLEAIWARPGWAVGFIPVDLTIEYQVHNQAAPSLNLRAYADTTLAYGYGDDIRGVLPGRLSWGTTVKFINRGYANKQVNALDYVADSKTLKQEDLREGYTVDFDLGLLYTPVVATEGFWSVFQLAKPTFGAVVRNVADYGFGSSLKLINKTKADAPEKLHRVFDVGAKFEYPSLWIFSGRGEIDFRDFAHPNFSWRRSMHIGFEFDWTVASWWKGHYRVGLNQGYITGGVSAQLYIFNLDFTTFAEDVGSYDTPKQNRIYMAKLNLDL